MRSNVRVFHLHGGVVERDEGGEQVQVASREHKGKQDLTLPRNTCEETAEDIQTSLHPRNTEGAHSNLGGNLTNHTVNVTCLSFKVAANRLSYTSLLCWNFKELHFKANSDIFIQLLTVNFTHCSTALAASLSVYLACWQMTTRQSHPLSD